MLEVRRVLHGGRGGRGVFARQAIAAGTVIERVPVLLIPEHQVFGDSKVANRACRISWYVFWWDIHDGHDYVGLPLGYGSLYNHAYEPNAVYNISSPDIMEFVALLDIKADEEITINYNGEPDDRTSVGFTLAE